MNLQKFKLTVRFFFKFKKEEIMTGMKPFIEIGPKVILSILASAVVIMYMVCTFVLVVSWYDIHTMAEYRSWSDYIIEYPFIKSTLIYFICCSIILTSICSTKALLWLHSNWKKAVDATEQKLETL